MKQKGFTLIELLVVVAIIGILAAVGLAAFNGFLGSAKINTMKANNKSIAKYIQTELQKCNLGIQTEAYEKYTSDPGSYHNWQSQPCFNQYDPFYYSAMGIMYYLHTYDEKGFSSPFLTQECNDYGGAYCSGINTGNECPTESQIGWTNIGVRNFMTGRPQENGLLICSRWGSGLNDVIETYIKNPF
jgi:prepilin-type N-terminal cleavage/methylation domain-containing protein